MSDINSKESPDYWHVRISPERPQVIDDYHEQESFNHIGSGHVDYLICTGFHETINNWIKFQQVLICYNHFLNLSKIRIKP